MNDPNDESAEAKKQEFWDFVTKTGFKTTGGLVGLGAAYTTKSPAVGIVVSNFVTQTLETVGGYLLSTHLAYRQKLRIGQASLVAESRLKDRLAAGETIRTDAFVQVDADGRSTAAEVIEAAMMTAMNSAEERKVGFLGALVTSISLNDSIGSGDAHLMIDTAHTLSFRGFCILQISSRTESFGWPERQKDDVAGPPPRLYPLMAEVSDLIRRGLVEMKDSRGAESSYAVLGADEIDPCKLFLTHFGVSLHKNLELERIPALDNILARTVADLGELATFGRGPAKASNATAVWG